MEQEMMNNNINNTAFVVASETKALSDSPSFGNSSVSSLDSANSDSFDGEVTSSYSSPSFADLLPVNNDRVLDMSSLIEHLPVKRGLSKHYHGKSRSFTSLADVRSLEDLAKPENPYAKKMKLRASTRSHIEGGIFKSSRVSCPSISARRANPYLVITIRPTVPPHHSTTTTIAKKQTPLLA